MGTEPMSDLVRSLRAFASAKFRTTSEKLCAEAADELEKRAAEIERLRADYDSVRQELAIMRVASYEQ